MFDLALPGLADCVDSGVGCLGVEQLYKQCFQSVFPSETPDRLGGQYDLERHLNDQAAAAGCSLELFIMACMLAHRRIADHRRFFSNYLFSPGAVRLVREAREAAAEEFGTADAEGIGELFGAVDATTELARRMEDSELIAGQWIVGYKRRYAGAPTDGLFPRRELGLDPVWLALEPAYAVWTTDNPPRGRELERHRQKVRRAIGWLKERRALAAKLVRVRSANFPRVVANVLHQFNLRPDDLMCTSPVHDALKFWARLGLVIQHIDCLRAIEFVDGP